MRNFFDGEQLLGLVINLFLVAKATLVLGIVVAPWSKTTALWLLGIGLACLVAAGLLLLLGEYLFTGA